MTGLRFFGIVHTGYSKNQGYAPRRLMVDITADHSMVPNVLATATSPVAIRIAVPQIFRNYCGSTNE